MATDIKLKPTCRCCLSEDGEMKNMQLEKFTFKSKKILLLDGFAACSGVNLNEESEDTCRTVCATCELQLLQFYEFREMCQVSTQTIRERFDIKQETLSNGDGDEVIYTDYLPYGGSEVQPTTPVAKQRPEKVKDEAAFVVNPIVEIKEVVDMQNVSNPTSVIKRESDDNGSPQTDGHFDDHFAQDGSDSETSIRKHKSHHQKSHKRKKIIRIKQEDEEPEEDETTAAVNAEVANMEANFMCYHCDQFIPTHAQYISHRQNHLWNRSPSRIERVCFVCGQSVYGYLKHIEEHHKDFRPNTCKLCDKGRFQKQNALRMHLFSHTTNTEFECLACHQKFSE
jgi:Zinc-finger associated domain (zf-AD)